MAGRSPDNLPSWRRQYAGFLVNPACVRAKRFNRELDASVCTAEQLERQEIICVVRSFDSNVRNECRSSSCESRIEPVATPRMIIYPMARKGLLCAGQ